jgi:DNA-binding response OmpR family regulator
MQGGHVCRMKAKVLVVDDEVDMLELLRDSFRAEGFDVRAAATGREALNEARCFLPDLIVLDLMLGELDGLSICEILRAQPSTKDIPVIVITAMGGSHPPISCLGIRCH